MSNQTNLTNKDVDPFTFPIHCSTWEGNDLRGAPDQLISSYAVSQLAKFGDFCLIGFDLCIATLIRSTRPLLSKEERVEWDEQNQGTKAPSAAVDLLQRIACAAAAIFFLIPSSLVALVFGVPCRLVTQPCKEEIVYLAPGPTTPLSMPENMTVMTQNMALSQFEIMNALNQLPSTTCRREAWWNYFEQLPSKPDVLCLQELFDPASAQILAKALQQQGYHVVYIGKPAACGFGLSGGLLTASKFPIESVRFENFMHRMGACQRANKGVLGVTLRIGPGVTDYLGILNTHLQAGLGRGAGTGERRKAFDAWVNYSQDDQITRFRNEFFTHILQQEDSALPCQVQWDSLLVGDFNRGYLKENAEGQLVKDPDYPLLQHLMTNGQWSHIGHHPADITPPIELSHARPEGSCLDRQSLGFRFPDQIKPKLHAKKLDFILYHTAHNLGPLITTDPKAIENSKVPMGKYKGDTYVTSDHAAIVSTCRLQRRHVRAAPAPRNTVNNSQWDTCMSQAKLLGIDPETQASNHIMIDLILQNIRRSPIQTSAK